MSEVNVVTQNVLLDYRRTRDGLILPQHKRIGSIAATFRSFNRPLDVVGIQEAHRATAVHNGESLARSLGYGNGFWVAHNQKAYEGAAKGRPNEYIGMFGRHVDHIRSIELGDNRRAVMTELAGVAFVTFHLRSGMEARAARREQATALNEALEPYENAVIFGDLNEPPIWPYASARPAFAAAGFTSVFRLTGQHHPPTSPIEPYREAAMDGRGWQRHAVRRAWSIDDIQVRGPRISVLAAGVLDRVVATGSKVPDGVPLAGSDHEGVWATLSIEEEAHI